MEGGLLVRQVKDPRQGDSRQIVLPQDLRREVIASIHNHGHSGFDRTIDLVRRRFYWPGMYTHVKEFCDTQRELHFRAY